MSLTVKVNGSDLGLVHKGSGHFAKCTAPDVCKTPSPGGPVPIPYPVIMSQSSDLKNGTSTVKADGGQMIAVKDCEYAKCNGDEAGTAGGVVSSTNMKEAKFILFSFDVKMDGKNACRNDDKMTMNHQNTICMMGTGRKKVKPAPFEVNIDCEKKRNNKKKKAWTRCMCQQLCAKIQKMEDARKAGALKKVPGAREKPAYKSYKSTYIKNFMAKVNASPPEDMKNEFVHPCAACEYEKIKPKNPTEGGHDAPFNADHMHEAGWGGKLSDLTNLKMMNKRVNQSISFQRYKPGSANKDQSIQAMATCQCPDGPPPSDESGCSQP